MAETAAKRAREARKRRKREDKQERKQQRRNGPPVGDDAEGFEPEQADVTQPLS